MTRIPVQSSNVEGVGYDSKSQTLEVEFKNGNIYQYFDVPDAVYHEMVNAGSAGKFLINNIKGVYRYARV
ncbi:MAG: KTSC domain-containing protein [Candidatus Aminicenantes bacterium]|nr:KTSC domain-containing protein [Candidatus Aminicenantes bacterium]